jgi:hypothetical protein
MRFYSCIGAELEVEVEDSSPCPRFGTHWPRSAKQRSGDIWSDYRQSPDIAPNAIARLSGMLMHRDVHRRAALSRGN